MSNEQPVARRVLDRAKWHRPLCSIIITHRNYSHLIEDAFLSLLDQTHENWECVVVDDFSAEDDRRRLLEIVKGLSNPRIRVIQNAKQLGQIETFFAGVAETTGEFVSPLDPDDRLAPTYLEEMLGAHLNEDVFCPIVTCDQKLLRIDGALLTGIWKGRRPAFRSTDKLSIDFAKPAVAPMRYFPPLRRNWLWSSSSAIMVRREALNLLVPNKCLGLNQHIDRYLVNGAHFLGGSIFLAKPLVYRGVHTGNAYLSESIFSMQQIFRRDPASAYAWQRFKRDVVEAMFCNGVARWLTEHQLAEILRAHFDENEMALLRKTCPEAYWLWQSSKVPSHSATSLPRRVWKRARRHLFGA